MFLSKGEGVSQGVREGTLWIFGRISDRRHSQCKGPVAGVSLRGCSVHEEVRSLGQSEGGWKEVRGERTGSRGQVSQNPQTTAGPLVLTLRLWEPLEVE